MHLWLPLASIGPTLASIGFALVLHVFHILHVFRIGFASLSCWLTWLHHSSGNQQLAGRTAVAPVAGLSRNVPGTLFWWTPRTKRVVENCSGGFRGFRGVDPRTCTVHGTWCSTVHGTWYSTLAHGTCYMVHGTVPRQYVLSGVLAVCSGWLRGIGLVLCSGRYVPARQYSRKSQKVWVLHHLRVGTLQ